MDKFLEDEFLKNGYIVKKAEDINALNWIKNLYIKNINQNLKLQNKKINDLNKFHSYVKKNDLNKNRLTLFNQFNAIKKSKNLYYNIAKKTLDRIVGNELAIQKNINLSIQIPNDQSSLLPLHSDTWSGDSPFEVVLWLPLVDCHDTKSMFILNQRKNYKFNRLYKRKTIKKASDLYNKIKHDVEFIDIKFGEFLLFNQNLPHGNIVNKTNETRFSMNCRFKSLFSPYAEKKLGSFFTPLNIKPATQIGLDYKFPDES